MDSKRARMMIALDESIKKKDALIQELQSKVARQRDSLSQKDGQIRQLREDKAMLLHDLKEVKARLAQMIAEAHGG